MSFFCFYVDAGGYLDCTFYQKSISNSWLYVDAGDYLDQMSIVISCIFVDAGGYLDLVAIRFISYQTSTSCVYAV